VGTCVLVAAGDPPGDIAACRTGEPASRPGLDIRSATGELTESGTALAFTVEFADELADPDPGGKAARVDVIIRDPRIPAFSFGPYRDVNRIIRYDHTDPPQGTILLLAEQGLSEPSTFGLEGRTLRITVAGRQLGVEGEDLESIDLRPLRWNVIARAGPRCDFLGEGEPTLRLAVRPEASVGPPPGGPQDGAGAGFPWGWLAVGVGVGLGLIGTMVVVVVVRDRLRVRRS
jgi:hypothetical protein